MEVLIALQKKSLLKSFNDPNFFDSTILDFVLANRTNEVFSLIDYPTTDEKKIAIGSSSPALSLVKLLLKTS